MSSSMRCRSALTGRSTDENDIGCSSHDEGTPCSRGNYAPLKTSSKMRISIDVQALGPWRGLGQRHNLACFTGQWFECGVCPTHNTNPAKRVRAWAQSGPGPLPAGGVVAAAGPMRPCDQRDLNCAQDWS